MQRVRELGKKLSNWGRWGAEDERGTLNFVTPEVVRRAAGLVKRGHVFSLGLNFGAEGPQIGQGGRVNPLHLMSAIDGALPGYPGDFRFADDVIIMGLQCATQWDSLAHVHYDGQLYNGFPAATTTPAGASKNGIDKIGAGVMSRGVLLDLPRAQQTDRIKAGVAISPADLEAAEKVQGVRAGRGDILLVRTGHLAAYKADGDRVAYMRMMPGLGLACAQWLHEREVAGIATDTNAVEVIPFEDSKLPLPFHMVAIRDMGLLLGEMFDLDQLAEDCAGDRTWEFLFSAPPLKVTGGIGSPLNPLAVK